MEWKKRTRTYSGTTDGTPSERERANRQVARKAAAEGMVLLKNEGILPLAKDAKAALYGGGAVHMVKGGTGSGDVNEREVVEIWQGFLDAGITLTNRGWLEEYDRIYKKAREDWRQVIADELKRQDKHFFEVYSSHVFQTPAGDPIDESAVREADVVFYVLSRTAGEGADRFLAPGDYYLTDAEKEELAYLDRHTENLAVILNTGGAIDLAEILSLSHLKGLICMSQPGMEGGHALTDVLTGNVTPQGKLTSTWALSYFDIPGAADYSHNNGNVQTEYYTEGIYVGYRYFDSFEKKTAFPFGFGLSYTTFDIRTEAVSAGADGCISVTAVVTNTGAVCSGREIVQVYVSCPQTKLAKERRRLCGFQKTRLLAPGESERVTIRLPAKNLVSFSEEQSAWIIEAGQYGVWVGNSSVDLTLSGVLLAERDTVLERVAHIHPLQEPLDELVCPEELRMAQEQEWKKLAEEKGLVPIPFAPGAEKPPVSEEKKEAVWAKELTAKLTKEQMIHMVTGEVSRGQGQTLGVAGILVPGAAGETSGCLEEEYGVPGVPMADGPAGIRLMKSYEVVRETGVIRNQGIYGAVEGGIFADCTKHDDADTYYQYATAIPVGTLLAQSWDPALLEEVGRAVAVEMEEFGIGWWLAPGMNIHRNPLCGRNFEYFSEDPLLSGYLAAGITRGVQSRAGTGTTIKHFACNNQEDNRKGSNSVVSERALREIYLRGFEIAVKTSQPMAIMTSYNLINGVHSANSRDLCTVVVREEWGFRGIIMTDWTTTGRGGSSAWGCVAAGNDLIMPGSDGDHEEIRAALADGQLDAEDLRRCVERMLTVIFQTNAFENGGQK